MIIFPIILFLLATLILWKETQFSFASMLERPLDYQSQKMLWLVVPKVLAFAAGIWLFFILRLSYAIVVVILAIVLFGYLKRVFVKDVILKQIEKRYPSFVSMTLAERGNELSAEEMAEKVAFAKYLSLRRIWEDATGEDPSTKVLEALIKTTGLLDLKQFLMR